MEGHTHAVSKLRGGPIAYRASFLLKAFLQADILRNNADLKLSVGQALRMVLPQSVVQAFVDVVETSNHVMPSASAISRWRVIIDGAMMNVERDMIAEAHQRGERFVRYLMAHNQFALDTFK